MTLKQCEENYYTIPTEDGQHILRGHFSLSDGGCCCVVAVINPEIDWSAYIGAAPHYLTEDEALRYVARNGCKLSQLDAHHFFPLLLGWNRYRQ